MLLFCCLSCEDADDDPSHFITYSVNGGGWRGYYTPPVEVEQAVTLPNEYQIVRTGYTFAGWYDNKELNGNPITGWKAGEKSTAITLWAKWISSDKSISSFTFTAGTNSALKNDVTGTIKETDHTIAVSVPFGTDLSALKATFTIVDTSSVVVGSVAQTSGETVNDFTNPVTYTVTAEDGTSQHYTVTVTIRLEYDISYEQNDGSWSSGYTAISSYKATEAVTLPAATNIVRTGYTFDGWYDNEALTGTAVTGWNAGDKNADITLWAKWIAVATLDSQGATTAGTESVTATYGDALPAITPPTRDVYTFAGYWTEKDGKGTQYYNADGSGTEGKTWDITENITLYAYWTVNASNAATAIAALTSTGSPHTVTLTGALSTADISAIKTALTAAGGAGATVALDMSACTGLEALPSEAFKDCSGLTSVMIPDGVKSIGDSAFYDCDAMTSVTIPDGVTSIGDSAFYFCKKLTSVTIPDSVKSIGNSAFYFCFSLTSVVIPNGVESIGDSVFKSCSGLTSVTIPDSVKSIGDSAFYYCSKLTSVTIPDGATSIGDSAFYFCSKLTSVTIPSSVTTIGSDAFRGCSYLTSVTIPDGVTSIGDGVFSGTRLLSVTIPNGVTSIGEYAFSGTRLTSVTIPNSVTTIGNYAFRDCTSLTSVTLPSRITTIGKYVFAGCTSLQSVEIPGSVTAIGNSAFSSCTSLTSVTIPNSVTTIGSDAFRDCSSLPSVTIPSNVTSIGSYAFYHCNNLTSLIFSAPNEWHIATNTVFSLTDKSENATYFKDTYYSSYWYK